MACVIFTHVIFVVGSVNVKSSISLISNVCSDIQNNSDLSKSLLSYNATFKHTLIEAQLRAYLQSALAL